MKNNLGKKRKKEESDINEESSMQKEQNQIKFKILDETNNLTKKNYFITNNDNEMNKIVFISKKENINNSIQHFFKVNKDSQEKDKEEIDEKFDLDKNNFINMEKTQKNSINDIIDTKTKNQIPGFFDNELSSSSPKNKIESQSKNYSAKFKTEKNPKNKLFGLKEISNRVMDIIKQNGKTTYKDISDQIVDEIKEKSSKEENNLRRRIYDSLNVMRNMNLFIQDKQSKAIMWNYAQEFDPLNEVQNKNEEYEENMLESDNIIELKKEIKLKKAKVNSLEKDLQALNKVLDRNKKEHEKIPENKKLYFPLIIVEFISNQEQKINVAFNEDQTKVHLGFDKANFMYGDLDIVSKIGNHPNFSN